MEKSKSSTNETQTTQSEDEKSKWSKFCQKRNINANLFMLKVTLFVMHGATSSLLPYLTIHMQSIGITVEEIAIIYLALPFTTFLAPPITGFLVDKFGKYKPVVIMTLLLNAVFHHALFIIPQQEIPGSVPAAFVIRHPQSGNVEVWWSPCPSRECPEEEEINIVVDSCIDHCLLLELNAPDPKIEPIPEKSTKAPVVRIANTNEEDDLNFQISKKKNSQMKVLTESTTDGSMRISPDNPYNRSYFNLTDFDIDNISEESEEESWVGGSGESVIFVLDMHPDLGDPIEQLGIEIEDSNDDNVTDFKQRFGEKLLWDKGVNVTALEEEDLRCGGLVLRHNMTISDDRLRELAEDCMVQKCEFITGGPEICPPDYKESDDKVFWIYFLLRFLGTTMLSGGVTMMDPIALTMIEKYGGDFGRERLFSMFGMAIFSPITGMLIDHNSKNLGYTDYSAAFYTYDVLLVITAITVFLMPLGEKLPADNVFRDLWNLLKMPHVICFIIFLFVLGNFWGFIESFLFLYLKELGAPNYLLGITITVGTISSIPFLYTAEKLTRIFGHVNLIVIAFFSHAGRLVGYSFIENAWWCFPFEAMEALSCHLMWVAAATYCSLLAPKNLLATLLGVLGMAHFSLGRGSGSFVGGFMIGEVGTRDAFRYMGLIAVAGGIAYKLIYFIWLKRFDTDDDNVDVLESGENEKLSPEPKMKDASTSMSQERLSLMIKYNQIGSLSSLSRGSKTDIDSVVRRRSSYSISATSPKGGSASKVDLLKSALEINHGKISNHMLRKDDKNCDQSLRSIHAESAPKLHSHYGSKNISQPSFIEVLDEDTERRDSIPEEGSEHHLLGQARQMKPIYEIDLMKQANIENEPNAETATDDSAGQKTKIETDVKQDGKSES
ncbi:hypothetical protein ACKWTF_000330 [Chironomus riparius]